MPVLDARDVAAQKAGALFDLALTQVLIFTQLSQPFAYHGSPLVFPNFPGAAALAQLAQGVRLSL
jgi:hypothetical protein